MIKSSKVFGGSLIVAGTAIGAGMLALPIVSSSLGFLSSLVIMIIMWLLSLFSALVTVEVILGYGKNISIPYLSEKVLGRSAKIIGSCTLLVLLYSVLSAYISGLSSIVQKNFSIFEHFGGYISLVITVIVGYILFLSVRAVDYTNRILFLAKIVLFFLVVFTFIPHIKVDNFNGDASFSHIPEVILVFFTSFGFHGSIPAVMKYVGSDIKSLRKVFVIGSGLPLVIYVLWQITTLGVLPFEGEYSFSHVITSGNSVGVFVKDLSVMTGQKVLKVLLDMFAVLAMLTSVFGVAIGLFDYMLEALKNTSTKYNRVMASVLTFFVPMVFAIYYPSGFIIALNFAAIALVILAILLPATIALKGRGFYKKNAYKVRGGNFMLYVAIACGSIIVIIRLLDFL